MSVVWLVPRRSPAGHPCPVAGIVCVEVQGQDIEAVAHLLAGFEIIVTSEVPIGSELLEYCRRVRGVIGIGPRASELVDWTLAERRGLLVAITDAEIDSSPALERLLAAIAKMENHLRALDDIAEHWEGT
ncbi:hypothetical protein ACUSIJ_24410 [Pseudochelatococcus sp. B33]